MSEHEHEVRAMAGDAELKAMEAPTKPQPMMAAFLGLSI